MLFQKEAEKFGLLNWDNDVCQTSVDNVVENTIAFIRREFKGKKVEVGSGFNNSLTVTWDPSRGNPMTLIEIDVNELHKGNTAFVSYDVKADEFLPEWFHVSVTHAMIAAVTVSN